MRQKAILIDIDGTIASTPCPDAPLKSNGQPDWPAWIRTTQHSPVNEWCRQIVISMALSGYHVIFLTARSGDAHSREITQEWLTRHVPVLHTLMMRNENDTRPDFVVKKEAAINLLLMYDIELAIDDKKVNIDVFRELGIPALHCADF